MARQVFNVTRDSVVCSNLKMADHYFARLFGLMYRPGMPDEEGLWIVPCNNIHSMFMFFLFDAVFMDKEGNVLQLIEKMKPWGVSSFVKNGHAVLELNGGVIEKTGVQMGDKLEIQPV